MRKLTKLIGLLCLLALPCVTHAQDFNKTFYFNTARTDGPLGQSFQYSGITTWFIAWHSAGAPLSSCAIEVDSSSDDSSWGSGDVVSSQSCTSSGLAQGSFTSNYVRINVTALTGGGLTVTLKGYGGGSGGGNVSTQGTITAGYIPSFYDATHIYIPSDPFDNGVTTAHTLTYGGSGGITAAKFQTNGSTAGLVALTGSASNPAIPSNSVGLLAPPSASFTSYVLQLPATAPSGGQVPSCGTPSSNVSTCSWANSGGSLGGTNTYTASQPAGTSDNNKLVVMNCSSACAYTLPATQPSTSFQTQVISVGSTLATIGLSGDTFNGSATAPLLLTGRVATIYANTQTATDYKGDAPVEFLSSANTVSKGTATTSTASGGMQYSSAGRTTVQSTNGNSIGLLGGYDIKQNVVGNSSGGVTARCDIGTVQDYTLTAAVTGETFTNCVSGSVLIFTIRQGASGFAWTWAASVKGGMTVSTTANSVNVQEFYNDGTNWQAITPGVTH